MSGFERLMVIGPSGSGKSTLTRELQPLLKMPVIHLDQWYWKEGWEPSTREQWAQCLESLMEEHPSWMMDGNFSSSFSQRMPMAQVIVFLDYSKWLYRYRVLKRLWTYHGIVRPDLGEGCPERFNWEFLRWVWGFDKHDRPKLTQALERYGADRVIFWLRSPSDHAEIVRLLSEWKESGAEEPPESPLRWFHGTPMPRS